MKHLDEHEMMIEYSEMTSFDFNSEEFQRIRKEYKECKNFISNISWFVSNFVNKFRTV